MNQATLLRCLQSGSIEPLLNDESLSVDQRLMLEALRDAQGEDEPDNNEFGMLEARSRLVTEPEPGLAEDEADELLDGILTELEMLHARNRAFAKAVGACDCFGDLGDCPRCDGEGRPGWRVPARRPFNRLVKPGLARLMERRSPRAEEVEASSSEPNRDPS